MWYMQNYCVNMTMHSLTLQDQILDYEGIDCSFVVCKKYFWTPTIFGSVKEIKKQNKSIYTCPICSDNNISVYPILTHDA